MSEGPSKSAKGRPLLDSFAFASLVAAEVALLRRKSSFLSLALIDVKPVANPAHEERLRRLAERLRTRESLDGALALRESTIAFLMPGTSQADASEAARRLLAAELSEGAEGGRPSAGIATMFDEVEGGRDALIAAAEEALSEAGPGQIVRSRGMDGRPQVLVVDDDEAFANMLAETISERGWQGHPCCDLADARERLLTGCYSGLFVDVVLAGRRDGIELLRRAIAYNPRRPVILMSGYDASHRDIMEALALGPVMFVQKPISGRDLDAALQMFRDRLPGATPGAA